MSHPVDTHVGKRVRQLRWLRKVTQTQLAEKVGIKFQQIQKYETGANRISCSRLYQIAEALGVEVSYFFEGYGGTPSKASPDISCPAEAKLLADFRSLVPAKQGTIADLARHLAAPA